MGACYEQGNGVAKDYVEAVKWCRKAADQNNAPAEYSLGACYANGEGVEKDDVEAVKWLRKAADQNDDWLNRVWAPATPMARRSQKLYRSHKSDSLAESQRN